MSRIIQPKAEPNHAQASEGRLEREAEPVSVMSRDIRSKPVACEVCSRAYAGVASAGLSWSNRVGKWACVRCHFASASTSKTSSSSTK